MALSKETYRAFEDIVGAANISDDTALAGFVPELHG